MRKTLISVLLFFLVFFPAKTFAEDLDSIKQLLETMQQDLQTLEKAVYNQDTKLNSSTTIVSNNSDDVLTKHLLKLSELEEQFRTLTNNFEEINFKLDKLSSRITKVQADNQMRFQDLEQSSFTQDSLSKQKKKKKLPGSDEPQDLGGVSDTEVASMQQVQQTQSVETVGTVITEEAGIPSVSIVSSTFTTAAQARAAALGMPDVKLVILPSPLTPKSTEEIKQLAKVHASEIANALIK